MTRVVPFVETLKLMGRYSEAESFYLQQLDIRESKYVNVLILFYLSLESY